MHNQNATYLLTDGSQQRVVLLVGMQLQVTLFVQRNVLDTRVSAVYNEAFKEKVAPNLKQGVYASFKKGKVTDLALEDVSDVIRKKHERARLLGEGYAHLLWYANMATEANWSSHSVDYNDLAMLAANRPAFIALYAECKNITTAEAEKQITFDEQNLVTLALRRNQILWTYEKTLLEVTTREELAAWKTKVYNDTVNVGAV